MDEVDTVRRYRDLFAESTLDTAASGIRILQETQSQPLTDVIHRLKQNFGAMEDDAIQRFVERCARLWLTLNIKSSAIAVGGTYHFESSLDWQSHQSIGQVAASIFVKMPRNRTLERPSKMDRAFTAQYLVDSCGLKLAWTDYLNEHLSMDTHRRLLLVYRHKAYLNSQVRYGATSLIPKDVLMETLDTLNLLFPFGDSPTRLMLVKCGEQAFYDLGARGRERIQDLSEFEHWREHLEALAEVLHSPPRTWRQLTFDRRNKLEWSAFWVTVMVALLTIISIPCSIIQATYSIKAYHATLAQTVNVQKREL